VNREVRYPQTISEAMNASEYGDTIIVYPGTYLERVTVKSGVSLYGVGLPVIDATGISGYGSSIEIAGVHDVVVSGFSLKGGANTSWSNVEGVAIRDLNNVGGVSSYNVIISNCVFTGIIPRELEPYSLGIGVVVYGYGDERLGHPSCHDIVIEDCYFTDCNPTNLNGITVGYITVIGNVTNITIRNNTIIHRYSRYNSLANGINFSGNYTPAYPANPRYVHVVGNYIEGEYPDTRPSQSIYLNVTAYAVVERNYIKNWSFGPMAAAEAGNLDEFTCHDIIIRRNIIEAYYYGVTVASWSSFYKQVYNIWVDSNTIRSDVLITDANGQDRAYNLLFTNNIITGDISSSYIHDNPFYGTQTEDVIRIDNLSTETPDWVTYNTEELDYHGTKQKRTKGAEEKQWIRRKLARKY